MALKSSLIKQTDTFYSSLELFSLAVKGSGVLPSSNLEGALRNE